MKTFWSKEFGTGCRKITREDLSDIELNAELADDDVMNKIADEVEYEMLEANERFLCGQIDKEKWSWCWWGAVERVARRNGLTDI